MVSITAFLNTVLNTTYNKTETEQELSNSSRPLYPPFLYGITPDRESLSKVFDLIPKWQLCLIASPLKLEWDALNEVCFVEKTLKNNNKQSKVKYIADKTQSTCVGTLYNTQCTQKPEVTPMWRPLDALLHKSRKKLFNKTELKKSITTVTTELRNVFTQEELQSVLDRSSEDDFCALNIAVNQKGPHCVVSKKMTFGKTKSYAKEFVKFKKTSCADITSKLVCSMNDDDSSDTPIPTFTSTPSTSCKFFIDDLVISTRIYNSGTEVRPVITAMESIQFGTQSTLVVSTPLEKIYVIWETLAYSTIDLKHVEDHTIPGQVLECSTLVSSQFGYSLAIYDQTTLVIGAPNATINNKAGAGIIFGIDIAHLYTLPNVTIDICAPTLQGYVWNITDSNALNHYRLGALVKGGTIYDNPALVFTEGSLISHDKIVGVVQGISQSADFAKLNKKNGFYGTFSKAQSSAFSSLEIGSIALGSENVAVVFIGCPDCTFTKIHGAGLVWSISPTNQPKSSSIGKQDTIFNSELDISASFSTSVGILTGNKIFIGAPYAYDKGALYTWAQPNTGASSFRGNQDVSKTGGGIISNVPNSSFGFLIKALDNTLMVGSPLYHDNGGRIDIFVDPHIQTGNTLLVEGATLAGKHISIISNSAGDKSMFGSGVMTFVDFTGQKMIGLSGSNASVALIFDIPSC